MRYVRSEQHLSAEVDGDVLFFDAVRGMYFATDGVGAFLWTALAAPRSLDELTALVYARYEVDAAICAADTEQFVMRLVGAGMVEPVSAD